MKNIFLKKVKALILVALILTTVIGCEDSIEGTVNIDPLKAEDVDPSLLLPQVLLAGLTASRTIEEIQMATHSQQMSFSVAFGVFLNPERGNISINTTNNIYSSLYTNGLNNLDQMIKLVNRNEPDRLNVIGQAKILQAFIFLNSTLIYGQAPFSEATQIDEFPNPNFDSQEFILRNIPTLLDEAVDLLSTDAGIISGTPDLIYGGDRENWIRFANSLKLKTLMLIANVDPTSVQAEIQEVANEPLITENQWEAKLDYTDAAGNQNPIFTLIVQFAGGLNNFYAAGTPLVNLMNANNDPRRATYFNTTTDGTFVGLDQGVFTNDGSTSQISSNIIRSEMPDRYITAAEINFYLAEAALQGWITGNANTFYQNGIVASLETYDGLPGEISNSDKIAYLSSSRGSIDSDTPADALRKIHEEHYIADFLRPLESWTTIRRNRVPDYQPITGSVLTDNLRRYPYPLNEQTTNVNFPGSVPLIQPMWFEK
ncbi:SusD/RagB family nutrient-binding outer membrane lipoprotein [Aquimarina sp. RZ0]|uniref:SusD/RagB family nutrient-binding outer membrane lipoprotein n=1 Tax=Aquimarina sp. RZ0 TaxID=2607730 RepID=UPI00165EC83A|nr:SusD/RagB family nutrient-binding outer membrane lipoprotein [Aquimarina sp. RZ0]